MSADTLIPLWPGDAPGVDSASPRHVPSYIPFLLPKGESRALMVVLPGGGYQRRAPHEGDDIALWLNSIGISAIVCHYRVAPYCHPCPSLDARRAIRTARFQAEKWGIDAEKTGVIGFSAGGHLAGMISTRFEDEDNTFADEIDSLSARPDAAILCYARLGYDDWGPVGSATRLLGHEPTPDELRYHSPYRHVSPETPPCFIWHTAEDPVVSVHNSVHFARVCRQHGVPVELHVYPYGRHGLGLAPEMPQVAQWTVSCANWLRQLGWR